MDIALLILYEENSGFCIGDYRICFTSVEIYSSTSESSWTLTVMQVHCGAEMFLKSIRTRALASCQAQLNIPTTSVILRGGGGKASSLR